MVPVLGATYVHSVSCFCCRTSARLLETKAANTPSQHNAAAGKNPAAAKNPAMVLALDRVNSDGALYSTGQAPSVPNGAQHSMSSAVSGKPSLYGGTQGWETVRRIFHPHRGESLTSTTCLQTFSSTLAQCFFNLICATAHCFLH